MAAAPPLHKHTTRLASTAVLDEGVMVRKVELPFLQLHPAANAASWKSHSRPPWSHALASRTPANTSQEAVAPPLHKYTASMNGHTAAHCLVTHQAAPRGRLQHRPYTDTFLYIRAPLHHTQQQRSLADDCITHRQQLSQVASAVQPAVQPA